MAAGKFTTTPSPIEVVEKVNAVIDDMASSAFDSYWKSGESVAIGAVRYVPGREKSGYVLECVRAGTTGSVAPDVDDDDLDFGDSTGPLSVASGGTGATTAAQACTNLGALSITGGTLTGSIKTTASLPLYRTTDDSTLEIHGGSSAYSTGSYLYLTGQNSSDAGSFSLGAAGNGAICRLQGYTDGTLKWNGYKVATFNSSNHLVMPDGSQLWIGQVI